MAILPGGSAPNAFGRFMRTLGVHAPRQLSELRRMGRETRALAGKPRLKGK